MKEIPNNIGIEKGLFVFMLKVYIILNTRKNLNNLFRRALVT